ncbi:hypothetical protein AB0N23_03670 [Streptomyces sp. NPDC052644]
MGGIPIFLRFHSGKDRLAGVVVLESIPVIVEDLRAGRGCFRAGLRVKGVRSAPGVFELTWDGNGRTTWQYGPAIRPGVQHVIWRRIGTHDILTGP